MLQVPAPRPLPRPMPQLLRPEAHRRAGGAPPPHASVGGCCVLLSGYAALPAARRLALARAAPVG